MTKLGVNNNARVQCTRSQHHGFYPFGESCRYCEAPKPWVDTLEHVDEDTGELDEYLYLQHLGCSQAWIDNKRLSDAIDDGKAGFFP